MTPGHDREVARSRRVRQTLGAVRGLAQGRVPEPSEAYWNAFLPSVRTRLEQRAAPAADWKLGRAVAAAAAVTMLAGAAASLMAPPPRPEATAALRQAGERMERAMTPDPRLSGEIAADLLGVDPMPGIAAADLMEALRDIAPLPAPTGTWPGIEEGELERSLDELDTDRAQRLLAELSASRG